MKLAIFIDAIYSTKEGLHNNLIAQKYSIELVKQPVQFGNKCSVISLRLG